MRAATKVHVTIFSSYRVPCRQDVGAERCVGIIGEDLRDLVPSQPAQRGQAITSTEVPPVVKEDFSYRIEEKKIFEELE